MTDKDLHKDKPSELSFDHRYLPRWEVSRRVFYKVDDGTTLYECRSKDINCSGICLKARAEHHVGQKIIILINLTDDDSIEVEGRVAWVRSEAPFFLTGVTLEDVNPYIQGLILQHAFAINQQELVQNWMNSSLSEDV